MSPKTRLAEKNNKEDALEKKKNESMAEKKKAAAEKKKAAREKKKKDSARKKKETSVKRRREAVKKKRDAAKKKTETETTEKKRKRNSGVDGGSLSNPTKRARNTASPPEQEHQGDHSPAPSAELPSQADVEGTPGPAHPSEPQKSPTEAPSEAENPLQPPVTSLSISESAINCPSHRVDNHDEEIVSNNRDSHTPEAAIDHTAQRTLASDYKKSYNSKLRQLMDTFGIETEAEIVCRGMGMSEPFNESGKMIENAFQSLTKEALSWFNGDEEADELAKASAWYIVTNHKDYVSTDCLDSNQLWSFPWCVYDRLVKIKTETARNKKEEVCKETH
ncbi:hypothetical protein F2Q69_00002796 [Brassica cretica]|uniref:RDRP C-terminal head domain-containing protein n=1 Tax=Brassica cretica TaxID=69181 RepID=A0A8S9P1X3_BRACR|nr:hypothetical protein F2Q69_00002796 [Brassica cretica]